MINVVKQTPKVYSTESRDYQVLANIYTVLYNFCKLYADNMNFWSSDIDDKLVDLKIRSLNLRVRHEWDLDDLSAVTSCFKSIMRVKGTENAIFYCILILMRINNINERISIDNSVKLDNNNLIISIPKQLSGVGILRDLLDYIVPAGITYRIIVRVEYHSGATTFIKTLESDLSGRQIYDSELGIYTNTESSDGGHEGYAILHNNVVRQERSEDSEGGDTI